MHEKSAIDLSGLRCPLPVLRTKKALTPLAPGDVLRVFATDPETLQDIPAFVKMAGHKLEESRATDAGYVFYIRKQ